MSVLMTLRVKADATKLEELASTSPDVLRDISARAKEHGAEYHRFYATDDELMVLDVWPDTESFHRFFEASPEIGGFMQQVGVTTEPEIVMWRTLATGDEIG